MNEVHECEAENCTSTETQEYHNGFADPEIIEWLCTEHAIDNGYCLMCQNFGAGSEDYDFSEFRGGHKGYHVECWNDLRADAGEFDDEDDEGWYDPYTEGWYDPDMDFENEESNGRDIGEGSETQGFFMDVDGSTVHVQGNPDMSDEQAETLANIVRATRAKMDAKANNE